MEIKDKLNARRAAMQMATDTMCAIVPLMSRSHGYDINDHIGIAKELYGWIVGKAELPEVYDTNSQTKEIMNVLMQAHENFKLQPLWLPILRDKEGVPFGRAIEMMKFNIPILLRSADGMTKRVESVEEFDKLDLSSYVEFARINDFGTDNPLTMGITSSSK